MKRRDFLKLFTSIPLVGTLGVSRYAGAQQPPLEEFSQGWTPNPQATEAFVGSLPKVYAEQVEQLVEQDNRESLCNGSRSDQQYHSLPPLPHEINGRLGGTKRKRIVQHALQ